MTMLPTSLCLLLAGGTVGAPPAAGAQDPPEIGFCPTEPTGPTFRGGGMAGDGWDGRGQNSATIYFHIENVTGDLTPEAQRAAYLTALATWAGVVEIHFVEIAVRNWHRAIDFRYAVLDHCAVESDECGDPDCPFDGRGGVLAHAGFPPGVSSRCVDPMAETWAGNVHFDDHDLYEMDDAGAGFSLTLIAAHEVGHSIGLTHDTGSGGPHIMRPIFSDNDGMHAPSASDISNLRSGYRAGVGSVTTLEDTGIWVNSAWGGEENGMPGNPFDTVAEGVAGLPPGNEGVVIHVLGGLYPETLTISTPCTITAEVSTAYIGR